MLGFFLPLILLCYLFDDMVVIWRDLNWEGIFELD